MTSVDTSQDESRRFLAPQIYTQYLHCIILEDQVISFI